jgi:hypothetical protein
MDKIGVQGKSRDCAPELAIKYPARLGGASVEPRGGLFPSNGNGMA